MTQYEANVAVLQVGVYELWSVDLFIPIHMHILCSQCTDFSCSVCCLCTHIDSPSLSWFELFWVFKRECLSSRHYFELLDIHLTCYHILPFHGDQEIQLFKLYPCSWRRVSRKQILSSLILYQYVFWSPGYFIYIYFPSLNSSCRLLCQYNRNNVSSLKE